MRKNFAKSKWRVSGSAPYTNTHGGQGLGGGGGGPGAGGAWGEVPDRFIPRGHLKIRAWPAVSVMTSVTAERRQVFSTVSDFAP